VVVSIAVSFIADREMEGIPVETGAELVARRLGKIGRKSRVSVELLTLPIPAMQGDSMLPTDAVRGLGLRCCT